MVDGRVGDELFVGFHANVDAAVVGESDVADAVAGLLSGQDVALVVEDDAARVLEPVYEDAAGVARGEGRRLRGVDGCACLGVGFRGEREERRKDGEVNEHGGW